MSRRSTKRFDYGKGIYYFNIKTGASSAVTIKRIDKKKAIDTFKGYQKTQKGKCEWLGKWDGDKFIENDFEEVVEIFLTGKSSRPPKPAAATKAKSSRRASTKKVTAKPAAKKTAAAKTKAAAKPAAKKPATKKAAPKAAAKKATPQKSAAKPAAKKAAPKAAAKKATPRKTAAKPAAKKAVKSK